MVMERCAFPYTHMLPPFLVELIYPGLDDDGEAFHQEDTAEQGYEEFLMDDHGANADDAADGEAAGVAKEDLGGEAVEPEVTDQRADEGREEDHEFFRARYVHHIEILRPDDTTGGIGEDEQGDGDDGRVAGTHTVHAVVEVRSVADSGYDEDGEEDEEDPAEAVLIGLSGPGEEVGVVEVMMLDEGDSGLGGLDLRGLLHDDDIILDMTRHHFVHAHGRTETQGESDDESESDLSGDLDPSVESVFVLAEGLDIIIREAECAHEEGGDEHEDHVDVRQFAEQQAGQEDGGDDDESAHSRYAFLRHIEGVGFLVALGLRDIMALHIIDEGIAEPDGGDECDDAGCDGSKRNIGE